MKEREYRAWDVECKCWIPSDFFAILADGKIMTYEQEYGRWIEQTIDIELVEYTCLKDKNGKKIFEGDIIKYYKYINFGYEKNISVSSVAWGETGDSDGYMHGKHFEWVVGGDSNDSLADVYSNCEIIGNAHQNPELMSFKSTLY